MVSQQKNDYIYHEQHMLRFPQLPNQKKTFQLPSSSPVVLSLVAPLVPIHNHAPRRNPENAVGGRSGPTMLLRNGSHIKKWRCEDVKS